MWASSAGRQPTTTPIKAHRSVPPRLYGIPEYRRDTSDRTSVDNADSSNLMRQMGVMSGRPDGDRAVDRGCPHKRQRRPDDARDVRAAHAHLMTGIHRYDAREHGGQSHEGRALDSLPAVTQVMIIHWSLPKCLPALLFPVTSHGNGGSCLCHTDNTKWWAIQALHRNQHGREPRRSRERRRLIFSSRVVHKQSNKNSILVHVRVFHRHCL